MHAAGNKDIIAIRAALISKPSHYLYGVGRELSLLRHWVGDPGDNPTTAIRRSCAAIHFPTLYNLQHHQRSVPLIVIPCLYGVGGKKIPCVSKKCRFGLSLHHIHNITIKI